MSEAYDDSGELLDQDTRKIVEKVIAVLCFFVSIAYVVLILLPSGWHTKVTMIWSFYIGLFNVHVRKDTVAGWVIDGLLNTITGKLNKGSAGSFMNEFRKILNNHDCTIQQLRDQFCNLEMVSGGVLDSCHVWSFLLYGSWMLALGLMTTAIFLIVGAGLLLAGPTKCLRWTSFILFCTAAFVNMSSFGGYVALSIQLHRWLTEIYGSHDGLTFSQATIACGGLTLLVCIIPVMSFACSTQRLTKDEDDGYQYVPLMDAQGNPIPVDQYGNPQYGPPPGAGQYPPQQGYGQNTQQQQRW